MRDRLLLIAGLALLCVAATVTTKYQGAFYGTFVGNGAGITNVVNTNYNASLFVASTNGSVVNSLAVTGTTGDGIRAAIRGTAAQTNDVLQVQTSANALVFGVQLNGTMRWANAPTNATMGSNTVLYLVVTNNGTGYVLPLHAFTN